jgi:hypothetical protein
LKKPKQKKRNLTGVAQTFTSMTPKSQLSTRGAGTREHYESPCGTSMGDKHEAKYQFTYTETV